MDLNWFNVSAPWITLRRWGPKQRALGLRLWNLFNRRSTQGHWWGVGLLQIGHRHLFYVGWDGPRALFLGRTG